MRWPNGPLLVKVLAASDDEKALKATENKMVKELEAMASPQETVASPQETATQQAKKTKANRKQKNGKKKHDFIGQAQQSEEDIPEYTFPGFDEGMALFLESQQAEIYATLHQFCQSTPSQTLDIPTQLVAPTSSLPSDINQPSVIPPSSRPPVQAAIQSIPPAVPFATPSTSAVTTQTSSSMSSHPAVSLPPTTDMSIMQLELEAPTSSLPSVINQPSIIPTTPPVQATIQSIPPAVPFATPSTSAVTTQTSSFMPSPPTVTPLPLQPSPDIESRTRVDTLYSQLLSDVTEYIDRKMEQLRQEIRGNMTTVDTTAFRNMMENDISAEVAPTRQEADLQATPDLFSPVEFNDIKRVATSNKNFTKLLIFKAFPKAERLGCNVYRRNRSDHQMKGALSPNRDKKIRQIMFDNYPEYNSNVDRVWSD
ncbi:PH domain-containing protein DDB_G0287875-like isoform X2 [Ptychodera flava]|uniref:PH domain-containing protein DDB_G0287875-like isoform X2 n=1 Tax=Ptychodera flava TaxID=63121 RepID=UPI00396A2384